MIVFTQLIVFTQHYTRPKLDSSLVFAVNGNFTVVAVNYRTEVAEAARN